MKRWLALLGVLILLTAGAAAQDEEGPRQLSLTIGEVHQLSPVVENPLSQPDTITLEFRGSATTSGIVSWNVTQAPGFISCDMSFRASSCNVTVPARSSRTVSIDLIASRTTGQAGQGSFVIEGTSRATKLSGKDELLLSVSPGQGEGRSAPGLTPLYLVLLALLAGVVYWRH